MDPEAQRPGAAEAAPPPTAEKLRVEGLTKVYGPRPAEAVAQLRAGAGRDAVLAETHSTVAVDNVAFSVRSGETFVVMGLSGSGKSTLIRCINRLIEPTAGAILVDGEDVCGFDAARLRDFRLHKVAMVFQHVALLPHRTVLENAEFGLKVRGLPPRQRRERAMATLEQVGLANWAGERPAKLSGGMQQRVGLARGLAVNPDILLMDEPFSALDPLIRNDMQQELLTLQRKLKKTIIFITHDLHEALTLGSRIAIMKDGRFVQVAAGSEIVQAPADDYVAAFTADIDRARVLTASDVMRAATATEIAAFAAMPGTSADTRLADLYRLCATGVPIAVVAGDGQLLGIVEPLEVFRVLAGTTARAG